MIKLTIKKNLTVLSSATFEDQTKADAWLEHQISLQTWGKPERWVEEFQISSSGEDISKAIAVENIGGPDSELKKYKFAADYMIETEDVTAKVAQEKTNFDSLKYLSDTDWYIIRFLESGVAVPTEVTAQRAAARAAIVH